MPILLLLAVIASNTGGLIEDKTIRIIVNVVAIVVALLWESGVAARLG